MNMNEVAAYFVLVAIYAVLEATWLLTMSSFYAGEFARNLSVELRVYSLIAALLCYVVLLAGFFTLVLQSKLENKALVGFVFGLTVYGVYNLTNKATMPKWSWNMVVADTVWGMFMFSLLGLVFMMVFKRPLGRLK